MSRHTFKRLCGDSDTTSYALYREGEGREAAVAGLVQLPDADGNHEDTLRMVCLLFDGLSVRDAEALAPADWVEIGADDDYDEDLYAVAYDEGYDEGFRDGSAAAFEMVAEAGEEYEYDDDDNYY